jgi:sulfur-oxidizing protein SoxY
MPGVKSITLLVDANPNPLSARFHFMPDAITEFKTRIKMGESSDVHAVIETDDAAYIATRNVKVTLGGCGG